MCSDINAMGENFVMKELKITSSMEECYDVFTPLEQTTLNNEGVVVRGA